MAANDKNKKLSLLAKLVKVVCITALAFGLSFVLVQPFSISTATLIASGDRSDFKITDFYNVVANSRHVRMLDPNIAIINIDKADREDIANILDIVNLCEPRAIGVDVTFNEPHADDSHILAAINDSPRIVLATTVKRDETDSTKFTYNEQSFFQADMTPLKPFGSVTMPSKAAKSTVRRFPVEFDMADGSKLPSFVTALAKVAEPESAAALMARNNQTEIINFPSREFQVYLPEEIAERSDELIDKIVLIGALNEPSDIHATPIDPEMSGVMIHAHALSTVLNDDFVDELTDTQSWIIAITICMLFVLLATTIAVGVKGLVLRVVQLIALYFTVRLGYYFFTSHKVVIDFSYTFLMITFGLFASDIWIGTFFLTKKAYSKIKNIKLPKRMKHSVVKTACLLACILSCLMAQAKYTLRSVIGDVEVIRAGKVIEAKAGMDLNPTDQITIGRNAEIEILNSVNSRIFTSVKPGTFSVTKIMIDAQMQSNDHAANVNNKIRMSNMNPKAQDVYVENGKVTRALEVYDPSSNNLQIDCEKLGMKLLKWFNEPANNAAEQFPCAIADSCSLAGGLVFEFTNPFNFPIYFNVVKMKHDQNDKIEISELGQPMGSYVVQPNQAIKREQFSGLNADESHYLVMTHYYFDIDELINTINSMSNDSAADKKAPTDEELPMYVKALN